MCGLHYKQTLEDLGIAGDIKSSRSVTCNNIECEEIDSTYTWAEFVQGPSHPSGNPGYTGCPNWKYQKTDFIIFSLIQNLLPLWLLRNITILPITVVRNLGVIQIFVPFNSPHYTHRRPAGSAEPLAPHCHPHVYCCGSEFVTFCLKGANQRVPWPIEVISCCLPVFNLHPSHNELFAALGWKPFLLPSRLCAHLCKIRCLPHLPPLSSI